MPTRVMVAGLALLLVIAGSAPASAQESADAPVVYRREVFVYQRAARPDPFRSLLNTADLGYRFEDLRLIGVVYSSQPGRSVAVFSVAGREERVRARRGDRLGGITILDIEPQRVDVLVNEFGVVRRESLVVEKQSQQGTGS